MDKELKSPRAHIDAIDDELLRLLVRRAKAAEEVGRIKRESGGENEFHSPSREAQILRRLFKQDANPLSDADIRRIFREIISSCRAREASLRIAYLGPPGTHSFDAARLRFGGGVEFIPADSVAAVFREAEKGACDFAVAPAENSTEGAVGATLDSLMATPLAICGETYHRIRHHLLARKKIPPENLRVIFAHPQSFSQCRIWLSANSPKAELTDCASNAAAAKRAAELENTAAIAPASSAEIYALEFIARDIEDSADNTTRFLILGKRGAAPSGDDKTSFVLAAKSEPGALVQMLEPLARNGINMNKLESRPSPHTQWDYLFFVDIDGHRKDDAVARTIAEVRERSAFMKILGSYPRESE